MIKYVNTYRFCIICAVILIVFIAIYKLIYQAEEKDWNDIFTRAVIANMQNLDKK